MRKRTIILLLGLLCVLNAFAQTFEYSGIKYKVLSSEDKTVQVSSGGNYTGNIVIPSRVIYEGDYYDVTSIGYTAFYNCGNLTSVVIPTGVTSIGNNAFYLSGIASIDIPSSVTSIGSSAFASCGSLSTITIPEGVVSIGNSAFYNCSNLTSITIPASVTSVGSGILSGCNGLTYIYVSSTTPPSFQLGFLANTNNCPIYVPDESVQTYKTTTGWSDYSNRIESILQLKSIIPNDEIWYTTSDDNALSPVFTDVFGAQLVSNTYQDGQGVLHFNNPVTQIGNNAFYGLTKLTSIIIPESVVSIKAGAFAGCSSLTSIIIEELNTVYDSRNNCNAIIETATNKLVAGCSTTIIPEEIGTIGEFAFSGCSEIISIVIPEGVSAIERYAFSGCSNLSFIILPEGLGEIENGTFYNCSELTSIVIPEGITEIGDSAFCSCGNLDMFVLPESVTSIGNSAFEGCNSLTSIIIPENVIEIGTRSLSACNNLYSITVEYGNNVYDSRNGCNAIIETATNKLIAGCTYTVIPNSVTAIGDYAFSGYTNLNAFSIPESVTSIGSAAFSGCTDLDYITILSTVPPTCNSNTFQNTNDCPLYVTATVADTYRTAQDWSNYSNRIRAITAYEPVLLIQNNEIWYTSWEGNSITPYAQDVFGANIVSNVYENGKGIITFDAPVTSIGNNAFHNCRGLTSITIPESVTSIGYDAFYECNSLTSVLIPDGVTSIGSYAFVYCSNLNSITIPSSVASIGNSAFSGCGNLTSITIPANVTNIYTSTFSGCSGLTSITIPANIISIANDAFSGCSGLTSIIVEAGNSVYDSRNECNAIINTSTNELVFGCKNTVVPEGVTSIGGSAFYGCSDLNSITIPASVTSIGSSAFYGCRGLTTIIVEAGNSVYDSRNECDAIINTSTNELVVGCKNTVIPESVTSIGGSAFYGCSGLTSITIPEGVTHIGDYAFSYCYGLTSVTISEGVTSIGNSTFYYCSGLISITIPGSVTNIGYSAFYNCTGLSYVIMTSSTPPICANSSFGNADYPLYVSKESVQEYKTADGWSNYADRIKAIPVVNSSDPHPNNEIWYTSTDGNVIIPHSQKGFGAMIVSNVYENGKGVITFNFPVTGIGYSAFSGCSGLTSITIPEGVTSIGGSAFSGCSSLASITIPEGVTNIGNSAFYGCSDLTSITIPEGVTSIGSFAFEFCSGLTTMIIPERVTSIGDYAFRGCSELASITIPSGVTNIGSSTFDCCYRLTSIILPAGVTSIGSSAFHSCYDLTSIAIPASVTSIGSDAFRDCSGLTSIIVEAGNSVYDSRNGCNAIIESSTNKLLKGCNNTVIPESVTSIDNYAFSYCSGLTSITIPEGITSIGNSAFYGCYCLTSITIPASVASIGNSAFKYCGSLSYVLLTSPTPPICTNSSFGEYDYPLYVPEGSLQEYQTADGWADYADRIKTIPVLNPDDPHPNNEIWYTSSNGKVITPYSQYSFGAMIVSNVYENGKGIITFEFPVSCIGSCAFEYCNGLTSITIPESVTSIVSSAFYGCSGLTSIIVEAGNSVYDSRNGCNAIINTLTNELIVGCVNTDIPESVTSIGSSAFQGCYYLTSVTIPTGVTNIGESAFSGCHGLVSITIPENVTNIGEYAFSDCIGLSYALMISSTPPVCGNYSFPGSYPLFVPAGSVIEYQNSDGWNKYADRIIAKPVVNPDDPHPNNEIWYTSTNGNVISPWTEKGFGARVVSNVYENGKGIITFDFPVTGIGNNAFYHCSGLTSITIPEGVTSIGDNGFYGCKGLSSITIPASVASISSSAFSGCSGLTSIIVEAGNSVYDSRNGCNAIIKSSTNELFKGCNNTVIPESVTSIGNSAFSDCSGLSSITIPASVTSIGSSALSGCSGLTSIIVDVGNSVYDSRNGCNAIIESSTNKLLKGCENSVIPASVTSIGSSAFSGCGGLNSITIPEGVISIGSSAFSGCSGLTSITISEGVTSIGDDAFNSCNGLISITIPASVTSIGDNSFSYCYKLSYVLLKSSIPPICTNSTFGENYFSYPFYVPEESVQEYKMAVGWNYYGNRIKPTPVVNPNDSHPNNEIWYASTDGNVITPYYQNGFGAGIVSNVYENGKGIITFDLPVTEIGYSAFYGCSGLTSITIPENVTSIGSDAFCGCIGLTSITIPASVTTINYHAFHGCSGLTSITIPVGLTTIDNSAFSFCSGLTSIYVESGNSVYDSRNECNAIINTLTNELVLGCKNTVIPESVTGIGSYAFSGCSGLTSITIPENVTSIGSYAFSGCSGLTSIKIPEGVTSFGDYSVFCDCSGLTSITIPEGVTSIGNSTFNNCSGLTSIKIPEGVTSIDNYAFSGCSGLASITIPENVTSIGNYAFTDCNLSYVIIKTLIPPMLVTNTWSGTNTSFDGSYPIFVSEGLVQEYQTADVWNNYADRIMAIPVVNPNDSHPNNKIWYTSTDGNIITPYSQKGFGASIVSNVYENGKGIMTFEIPVTSLGSGAFNSNDFISITIPESVTSISSSVFSGCGGLTSISIEVGNTVYDSRNNSNAIIESSTNELVAGCKNTVIPESVTSIGSYAFSDCSGLTSFTIPACVTSIGDYSFSGCSGLTSIEITEGVTSIGSYAFSGCSGLTSITIPESVTSIGSYAFYGCSGLTSIIIPESVTSIGSSAFRYLDLSYVVIKSTTPPLCTSTAFRGSYPIYVEEENVQDYRNADGWSYYTNRIMAIPVVQPDDPHPNNEIWYTSSDGTVVTPYSQYFYGTLIISNTYENGKGIITFDYPVTRISSSAFYDCCSLTSITIPESVTGIGRSAFEGCSGLTSITIPGRVTTIGDAAFNRCSNLSSVTIYSSVLNNIGYSIFADNASGRKIYVFGDLVDYYKYYYLRDYSYDIEYIPDLNTNDAGDGSGRWCTYYNGYADVRVDDYTTIYKATLNIAGNVTLTEIPGHIIKKGEAVLLNSPVSGVELYSGTWVGDVGDYQDNELKGVDVSTPQSDGVAYYVLSKVNDQFGFYRLQQDVPLRAGRAYMTVANSNHAPIRNFLSIGGNDDSTTEIKAVENEPDKDAWYTIYGQKLDAEPTESGMYIHNGQKVLIK